MDLTRLGNLDEFARNPHFGTHVDAPAYLIQGGQKVADFGLDRYMCNAVLLDLSHKEHREPIDDEDLEAAEEAAAVGVREGEAGILYTGTDESAPSGQPSPYLSKNGADYLEFKGVSLVGIDSVSLDDSRSAGLPAHETLLGKGILVLEGLQGIGVIEAPRFRLFCLPLRLNAATSPVRAVAVLD